MTRNLLVSPQNFTCFLNGYDISYFGIDNSKQVAKTLMFGLEKYLTKNARKDSLFLKLRFH